MKPMDFTATLLKPSGRTSSSGALRAIIRHGVFSRDFFVFSLDPAWSFFRADQRLTRWPAFSRLARESLRARVKVSVDLPVRCDIGRAISFFT